MAAAGIIASQIARISPVVGVDSLDEDSSVGEADLHVELLEEAQSTETIDPVVQLGEC